MKILYSIQATGNGHISRAMEILPHLKKYGDVSIFLSGANSTMDFPEKVAYRSRGLSFFYSGKGGLDYLKTISRLRPLSLIREVIDLPVEKFDLVINDFESITALACAHKGVPSLNFSHQASFLSDRTPRPAKKSIVGEWVLRNYAIATEYIGLHFKCYDDFIFPPVIKQQIYEAQPKDLGHITVYLPAYSKQEIKNFLPKGAHHKFHVFTREQQHSIKREGNIFFYPVLKDQFTESLINCAGIITNAGFETPAEALYLNKKLMVIPIAGQYEQQCNAAALQQLGVTCLQRIDRKFYQPFFEWLHKDPVNSVLPYTYTSGLVVELMMHRSEYLTSISL